jgi:ATP-dependent helicase/nuclease subunit A
VSGKIDRLAISDGDVLIVDYKTGRSVPRSLAEIPQNYIAQLAIYRALLRPIYPDKTVRAALLFTERPVLFELPPESLDAALSVLTSP